MRKRFDWITKERLANYPSVVHEVASKYRYFFLFLLGFNIVYITFLVAFFPGIMSTDSVYQWKIAKEFTSLDNAIPYLHTVFVALLMRVRETPAMISLVQIAITSLSFSYFLDFFIRNGVRKPYVFIAFLVLLIQPSIAIYNITLWKDVLYTQLLLIIAILFVRDIINKSVNSPTKKIVFLAILIALTASIRYNGVIYIVIAPSIYYAAKLLIARKAILLLSTTIGVYLFLQVILPFFLPVDNSRVPYLSEYLRLGFLGSVIQANKEVLPEERKVIERVASIETFRKCYNCQSLVWVNNCANISETSFADEAQKARFDATVNKIILRNLPEVIADRTCMFANNIGLGGKEGYATGGTAIVYKPGISEGLDISQNPPNKLTEIITTYVKWSKSEPQIFLLWGTGIPLVAFILFALKAFIKRNKLLLCYCAIVLANIVFLLGINYSSEFRYFYILQYSVVFLLLINNLESISRHTKRTSSLIP